MFNSNSFANRSNEDIEAGLRREYQRLCDRAGAAVGEAAWASIAWRCGGSASSWVSRFGATGYEASVPEVLTAPVAYHAVVHHCSLRGPCGVACFMPLGNIGLAPLTPVRSAVRRLTLSYLCKVGSNHVVGPTVRRHRDMTVRSIFVISTE
ncbi:hypothetical protein GW17_00035376 [Ensete ventricosum]|nr:hypothetical protein GW17_00035376 [Ensete ventricosum]